MRRLYAPTSPGQTSVAMVSGGAEKPMQHRALLPASQGLRIPVTREGGFPARTSKTFLDDAKRRKVTSR
jgi:hypothetical protein